MNVISPDLPEVSWQRWADWGMSSLHVLSHRSGAINDTPAVSSLLAGYKKQQLISVLGRFYPPSLDLFRAQSLQRKSYVYRAIGPRRSRVGH